MLECTANEYVQARFSAPIKRHEYLTPINTKWARIMEDNGTRFYVSPQRQAGFYIEQDGTLGGMFSRVKGLGDDLVRCAIYLGATKLDCFDGYLPVLYKRHGFVEHKRVPFDMRYKPEAWDVSTNGTPDVVYMRLDERRSLSRPMWAVTY